MLAWPGYRVYRHEINESAKTLDGDGTAFAVEGGVQQDGVGLACESAAAAVGRVARQFGVVASGSPRKVDKWFCACGFGWNTFDTGGVCPACLHQWNQTQCLSCSCWSPHSDWYAN